ncbi:hypothetical protein KY360_05475 [Candidatus Woesearchaeota archaeon]|nr:hypothetical protein [Candidatus Woesearchaeota archaeon]
MPITVKDIYDKPGTPTAYIRYKGIWNMQDLYQVMVDFFRRRKFKFYERIYKHKHPSPFGIERQYVWRAERKESEYRQLIVDVYYHVYDAYNVDVVLPDGKKKTMVKGRLWMEFKGNIQYDWEKRWQDNVFWAELKNFFNKYIIRKKWEQIWFHQLWTREIHGVIAVVREKLKMESKGHEYRYKTGVHKQ